MKNLNISELKLVAAGKKVTFTMKGFDLTFTAQASATVEAGAAVGADGEETRKVSREASVAAFMGAIAGLQESTGGQMHIDTLTYSEED